MTHPVQVETKHIKSRTDADVGDERSYAIRAGLHFVALAVFVLLAVGLVSYISAVWSRHVDISALQDSSTRRLANLKSSLFSPTEKFSYLPEVLANYPAIVQALKNQGNADRVARANDLLNHLNATAKSSVIYVLNVYGVVVASSNWQESDSFVGKNFSYRPYFRDAMRTGNGRFYAMGTTTLIPGYYLSNVIAQNDFVIGVVVVKIDLNASGKLPKTHDEIMVTDRNGVIFLSSNNDWKYRPLYPLSDATLNQIKRTRQYENALKPHLQLSQVENLEANNQLMRISSSDANQDDRNSQAYFVASERIEGSDWSLYILTPTTEIDKNARNTALISGVALTLAALLYFYISRVRGNSLDREAARQSLEEAHGALEQQHRRLQTISEELRITSTTDPLTGAYNRRYFFEVTDALLAAQRRTEGALSIMMIDIDHFKRINDVHGHPAGDCVLKTLTLMADEVLREVDLFARFGGEEFIVVLPRASATEAFDAAERLRQLVMSTPFDCCGVTVDVQISCGVAEHRHDAQSIEDTIKRADRALYAAKNRGRNQVAVL